MAGTGSSKFWVLSSELAGKADWEVLSAEFWLGIYARFQQSAVSSGPNSEPRTQNSELRTSSPIPLFPLVAHRSRLVPNPVNSRDFIDR